MTLLHGSLESDIVAILVVQVRSILGGPLLNKSATSRVWNRLGTYYTLGRHASKNVAPVFDCLPQLQSARGEYDENKCVSYEFRLHVRGYT